MIAIQPTRDFHPFSTMNLSATSGSAHNPFRARPRKASGFTLIELLVVIAIIVILAGLGFAGITGALKTARKSEVRAMANQIKLALTTYYSEYGVWPQNTTTTDMRFVQMMTGQQTNQNRRQIRFLEVPSKFMSGGSIVTPKGFYQTGQSNFSVVLDTNYDGRITVPGQSTAVNGSVAVFVSDPDKPGQVIGTW